MLDCGQKFKHIFAQTYIVLFSIPPLHVHVNLNRYRVECQIAFFILSKPKSVHSLERRKTQHYDHEDMKYEVSKD